VGAAAVCLAHRCIDLPRIFTTQATIIFAHAVDPNERQWLRSRLGREAPDLPRFHFGVAPLFGGFGVITASQFSA
jgi:hypothetical protein